MLSYIFMVQYPLSAFWFCCRNKDSPHRHSCMVGGREDHPQIQDIFFNSVYNCFWNRSQGGTLRLIFSCLAQIPT